MSKVDKIYSSTNYFLKLSNIFKAYEGALDQELDNNYGIHIDDMSKDEPQIETINQKILNKNNKYQSPLKTGKLGLDNEQPWIISGFVGKQTYISPRHPQGHEGVDFGAPMNAPVYPIAGGKVIQTSNTPKGGLNLTIYHEEDQLYSYYAHLSKINVSTGNKVTSDTIIGLNGDTGSAKGTHPHVHLECKRKNVKLDPKTIIGKEIGSIK